MPLFDNLMKKVGQDVKSKASQAVSGAMNSAMSAAQSRSETFTFAAIPTTPAELSALPEGSLDSPYKTTALAMLALLRYEADPEGCFALLDAIRGPEPMNPAAKSFLRERLSGKEYKPRSFFAGATVQNNYTPANPLSVTVSSNPYSFTEENWATMYVTSSGADAPRQLKLRKKPSTGQWFLTDIQCLSDIREPASSDPWA